jgi:hypothetical protein
VGVHHVFRAEPQSKQPLASRIMKFLRDRRANGLPEGATVDQIAVRLRVSDRALLRVTLNHLEHVGKVRMDAGPQGLADQRRPDRWSAL